MSPDTRPKILVDHCAIDDGRTLEAVSTPSGVNWGGHRIETTVAGYRRLQITDDQKWLHGDLPAMNALAREARLGRVRLYTYQELQAERLKSWLGTRNLKGDVWIGVCFEHLNPPLDRSAFGGLTIEQFASREHQSAFYEMMLQVAKDSKLAALWRPRLADDAQREAFDHIREFQAIVSAAGKTKIHDAFHLWTAMRSGCDYFVTSDRRFLTALRAGHRDKALKRKALNPVELCEALGVPPRQLPVAEGEFVSFMEAHQYKSLVADDDAKDSP